MHLVIRNSSTKCLEVYIQESVELYHFFNENFEELKKGTNGIWTIPTITIENETKHKKFVLSYDSENYNDDLYITWIIQEALQLKENIVLMLKKRNSFIVQRNEEDTKIKVAISNVKRSEKQFQYSSDLKLKTIPKIIHGISIYKREKQVALNALNHANYKCEVDEDHKCFLRKDGETPYTEAHHLVPLSFQDDFEYIDGHWYYFDSNGYMITGWKQVGTNWYYFTGSGIMASSQWMGNYYFEASGAMATKKWIGNYHVDANGKWDKTR